VSDLFERMLLTIVVLLGFALVGIVGWALYSAARLAIQHDTWLGGAVSMGIALAVYAAWWLAGKNR
jgi:hypothetical protein